MTAYLIDSSITPLHFMVSDDLIVTDRARTHLAADGWTPTRSAACPVVGSRHGHTEPTRDPAPHVHRTILCQPTNQGEAMSMNGNPHYDDARGAGIYYATRRLDAEADVIALAATEATLALAYEQRTANLIAALGYFGKDLTGWPKKHADAWIQTADDIDKRLGLSDA